MTAATRAAEATARRLPRPRVRALPWSLAAAGVLVQVAFPLTGGGTLGLTVASVVLFAAAAVADASVRHGPVVGLSVLVGAGGVGLVAEAVGVRTGFPFGGYDYTGSLGLEVAGVPVLVPLAWVMMAWPALAVGRRLAGRRGRLATTLVGAWALAAWDVFLDPQMVDAGHWVWDDPTPALPGVEGIPVTNFVGWLLVSVIVIGVLDRIAPRCEPAAGPAEARPSRTATTTATDAVPLTVYLWTYTSSVLAHAAFFGRPPVALVGALVMGVVAGPVVVSLLRGTRR